MRKYKTTLIVLLLLSVLTASLLVFVACNTDKNDSLPPKSIDGIVSIKKNADRDFKIMLMTDLQLWSNERDNRSVFELMDSLVASENPDLIVLPGDNVSGLDTKSLLQKLIKKMDSYKIPWAPVYGNHDTEGILNLEKMSAMYESSEYCLFERGNKDPYGMGNYAVNIADENEILYTVFLFDNGRYYLYPDGSKSEVFMDPKQIEWYEQTIGKIANAEGKIVPSMSFAHFALPEFRTAIETLCEQGEDGKYYVPKDLGFGYCDYLPGVAPVNTGFFDKIKELGSTTHVFCGHDHENTASIDYQGVRFTYGLKTGISPRNWNDATEYGATIIKIGNSVELYNNVMWKKQ